MTTVILQLAGVTRAELLWALDTGARLCLEDAVAFRRMVDTSNQSPDGDLLSEKAAAMLLALREAITQGQRI